MNFFVFAENLAYKKKTSSSNQYKAHYGDDKAVDMMDNSLFASKKMVSGFGWIRIDMDDSYFIHEVLLFSREDCCSITGSSLEGFQLRIGESFFRVS